MISSEIKKYYYCYTCPQLVKDLHIHALTGHEVIETELLDTKNFKKLRFRLYTLLMFYSSKKELMLKLTPLFENCAEYVAKEDFFKVIRQSMQDLTTLHALHKLEMLCDGITELIKKEEELIKLEMEEIKKQQEKRERYLESHRKAVRKYREKKKNDNVEDCDRVEEDEEFSFRGKYLVMFR
jgi:hypothetical protein